jgi:hypothetical protein
MIDCCISKDWQKMAKKAVPEKSEKGSIGRVSSEQNTL